MTWLLWQLFQLLVDLVYYYSGISSYEKSCRSADLQSCRLPCVPRSTASSRAARTWSLYTSAPSLPPNRTGNNVSRCLKPWNRNKMQMFMSVQASTLSSLMMTWHSDKTQLHRLLASYFLCTQNRPGTWYDWRKKQERAAVNLRLSTIFPPLLWNLCLSWWAFQPLTLNSHAQRDSEDSETRKTRRLGSIFTTMIPSWCHSTVKIRKKKSIYSSQSGVPKTLDTSLDLNHHVPLQHHNNSCYLPAVWGSGLHLTEV